MGRSSSSSNITASVWRCLKPSARACVAATWNQSVAAAGIQLHVAVCSVGPQILTRILQLLMKVDTWDSAFVCMFAALHPRTWPFCLTECHSDSVDKVWPGAAKQMLNRKRHGLQLRHSEVKRGQVGSDPEADCDWLLTKTGCKIKLDACYVMHNSHSWGVAAAPLSRKVTRLVDRCLDILCSWFENPHAGKIYVSDLDVC